MCLSKHFVVSSEYMPKATVYLSPPTFHSKMTKGQKEGNKLLEKIKDSWTPNCWHLSKSGGPLTKLGSAAVWSAATKCSGAEGTFVSLALQLRCGCCKVPNTKCHRKLERLPDQWTPLLYLYGSIPKPWSELQGAHNSFEKRKHLYRLLVCPHPSASLQLQAYFGGRFHKDF